MTVVTTKEYQGLTGDTTTFTFPFEVQKNEDVYCKIDGVLVAKTEYIVGSPYPQALTFNEAPVGDLLIFRDTKDSSMRAVFANGNVIRARDLNDNYEQLLFIIQENSDNLAGNNDEIANIIGDINQIKDNIITIEGDIITINDALANDYVKKDGDTMRGALSMGGFSITNLKYPDTTDDAANVQYVLDRVAEVEAGNGGDPTNIEVVAPINVDKNEVLNKTTISFVISTIEKEIT